MTAFFSPAYDLNGVGWWWKCEGKVGVLFFVCLLLLLLLLFVVVVVFFCLGDWFCLFY